MPERGRVVLVRVVVLVLEFEDEDDDADDRARPFVHPFGAP
jgi:hypothetical protein